MKLYEFIKPLGILTYIALLITLFSGMKKWKLETHKLLATIAIALATIHGIIVYIISR